MKLTSLLIENDGNSDLEDALDLLYRFNEKVKEVAAGSNVADELTFASMEVENFLDMMNQEPEFDEPSGYQDNYMDDGDALASAGMGTDEDYGDYGGDYY